ncbi:MAG TPA: glucokinase [Ktedonobacteraceae bacterium]|nr:glucokinase [Ktedonobacteraceae bacterium]
MLLAGDIGGTKTNLALFENENGWREPVDEATFPSGEFASLEALVQAYLAQQKVSTSIDHASFGVAGPVMDGHATITNLPWKMDEKDLQDALHIPTVRLLNDLDAIAHAVPFLDARDVSTINQGQVAPKGAIAVIAPGTGLGEAFLTWNGSSYQTHSSEGGHADFAPSNPFELDLLRYLLERFPHVSYERVCSGKGFPNIYAYLKDAGHAVEPSWLAEELANAQDKTPIIMKAALDTDQPCDIAVATLNTFVSVLGAEAGNMALKVLATGGVYLGGGIPPRILPYLSSERFMQSFCAKGRLGKMLTTVPVHVILNPKVALLGAARHGFEARA